MISLFSIQLKWYASTDVWSQQSDIRHFYFSFCSLVGPEYSLVCGILSQKTNVLKYK
jgi:hypothetical protein